MMTQIAYLSRSTEVLSESDLMEILEVARRGNLQCDVTGLLLYSDGAFFQVLEGEKQTVHNLYDRIWGDSRHHKVWLLHEIEIAERDFPRWSMGFQRLDEDAVLEDAFFELTHSNAFEQTRGGATDVLIERMRQFADLRVSAA